MNVELTDIVLHYREIYAGKLHEAIVYKLAVKNLEEEVTRLKADNERLKAELDGYKGIPGEVPENLPPDE